MSLDSILEVIFRPFREITRMFSQVSAAKTSAEMDLQRARQAPGMIKSDVASSLAPFTQGQGAQNWSGQNGQPQQNPQAAQPSQKKKMSFWPWSKKTCIRCSQKLHKTWDQCPYCGQSQNAPVLPGAPGQPGGAAAPAGPGAAPPLASPAPTPGMPQKTIAMDVAAINAPLLGTGDRGENVAWLVPLDGALTGELLQIKAKSIIGTGDGCDIRVFDASISGRHAELTLGQNNRYRITDLGSRNGTYVNDKTIASIELVDGDNIRLGRTTFRFKTKA